MSLQPENISRDDPRYPARLSKRLGTDAPPKLVALGSLDLLALPKIAIFCSSRCPGSVVLPAYDQAAKWRDAGQCVISGFHSPVEKECLAILLRGTSPIIICPARSLERFRIPSEWQPALDAQRLLILSPFVDGLHRPTADTAHRRNKFVAALASEVLVIHATPGGKLDALVRKVENSSYQTMRLVK